MTLGTILGASFQVMRRNPRTTLLPALVIALFIALVAAGGIALVFGAFSRVFTTTSTADAGAFAAGSFLLALLVGVAASALVLAATAMLQALIIVEISRGTLGERLTFGQAWARARSRLGAIVGYGALLIVAIVVAITLVFVLLGLVTAGLATSGDPTNPATIGATVAVVIGGELLVFAGGGVLWAWLGTKLAFVPSAIVLERLSIRTAIARSWTLTRGFFWRTFGILILVYGMVYIATNLIAAPVQVLVGLGGGLLDPTGASAADPQAFFAPLAITLVILYAVTSFVSSIGMVVESATTALLYLDLRMRKEGLDLELSRFVEARQTGADVPDPYLPRGAVPAAPPTP
jgi:membrane-anchored glycerophosphoryl diester phosphodiesterase (GDPDase)